MSEADTGVPTNCPSSPVPSSALPSWQNHNGYAHFQVILVSETRIWSALKGCSHADSFCLRGNFLCGASQSQICPCCSVSTELLSMHPHTHTGLHARIFLLQTNFIVSSIVTNTQTSSETLPIAYCLQYLLPTVYLHVLHGRRKAWSWHSPYDKSISGKKKSNPMPCYCFDMNCILMGKNCQFFSDIWWKVLETYT